MEALCPIIELSPRRCRYRRLVEDFCCESDWHLASLAVLVAHGNSKPNSGCLENLWRTAANSIERIACGRSGLDLCAFLLHSIQPGSSAEVWNGTRIGYDAFSAVSRHRLSSGIWGGTDHPWLWDGPSHEATRWSGLVWALEGRSLAFALCFWASHPKMLRRTTDAALQRFAIRTLRVLSLVAFPSWIGFALAFSRLAFAFCTSTAKGRDGTRGGWRLALAIALAFVSSPVLASCKVSKVGFWLLFSECFVERVFFKVCLFFGHFFPVLVVLGFLFPPRGVTVPRPFFFFKTFIRVSGPVFFSHFVAASGVVRVVVVGGHLRSWVVLFLLVLVLVVLGVVEVVQWTSCTLARLVEVHLWNHLTTPGALLPRGWGSARWCRRGRPHWARDRLPAELCGRLLQTWRSSGRRCLLSFAWSWGSFPQLRLPCSGWAGRTFFEALRWWLWRLCGSDCLGHRLCREKALVRRGLGPLLVLRPEVAKQLLVPSDLLGGQ